MDELAGRSWSGNVRELKNAIEHAFVYCPGDIIDIKGLGQCENSLFQPLCGEKRKGSRRASNHFSSPAVIPPNPIQATSLDANTLLKRWNSITGISDALPLPWVCTARLCGGTCRA